MKKYIHSVFGVEKKRIIVLVSQGNTFADFLGLSKKQTEILFEGAPNSIYITSSKIDRPSV
jgi:hypothetical protein